MELLDLIKTIADVTEIIRKKINPLGFLIFSVEAPDSHFHFMVVAKEHENELRGLEGVDLFKNAKKISRQELLKIKNMFT